MADMPDVRVLSYYLRTGDVGTALDLLQPWAATASYPAIAALIDECPLAQREHLTLLLKDILSGWPEILWGAPTVFYLSTSNLGQLELPLPACPPDENIISVGWTSYHTIRQRVRLGTQAGVSILANKIDSAVLLLRTRTDVSPEAALTSEWWSELLVDKLPDDASINLSSRMILSLPAALEASCAMLSGATTRDSLAGLPRRFLSESECEFANRAGRIWWEQMAATR